MKKIWLFILLLLILPSVLAIDLEVEKLSSNEVIISELSQAATFDLSITNNEGSGVFTIYNLLGFEMEPKTVQVSKNENKLSFLVTKDIVGMALSAGTISSA
ncbi:MAG: hypothetical protein IIB07_07665 [Bacteroidetes bacterium]|nr:hypothetical protein [Bacteroidota bacterium]